jgi:GTPase SAR1 family protein
MNGSAKLGIGHSYFELVEHKKKNPGLTTVFQPVPIFMFGHSGVGKTSYLTAFSYDIQMRSGKTIALGRESQVLYELHQQAWRKNDLAPTTTIQAHNFWQDLNVTGFQTHDYGGKDTQPDQWEQQLQEAFRNARGLFFMIEASDCADSARLRAKANWFDAILQYWMQANPALRHVPVGIIITKSDLLFGDELAALTRTSLLPLAFEQVLVETPLQHRFPHATQDVQSPIGRLRHLILCDRLNNVHPILQDIAEGMLDNFSQFLSRILGITYNYQIFLTSSLPPRVANDSMHPWGIREPMFWMLKILEKYHLSESKHKFEEEEKQVADQIRVVQEDIAQLRALQHETTSSNDEIARIHNKPTIFVEVMKQRLKFHEERRQRAEQEFFSIVQRYVPGAPQSNKALALQMVEREVKTKEKFLGEIRSKRTDFERRLKEHQIER